MGMTRYYAEVILEDDITDEPHVIDGEATRYEDLIEIRRHAGSTWDHLEDVTFVPAVEPAFTERCYFKTHGVME